MKTFMITNKGLYRKLNEDTIMINQMVFDETNGKTAETIHKFGVFDGVGGLSAGNVASNFVGSMLSKQLINKLDELSIKEKLIEINNKMIDFMRENQVFTQMGTTLALLTFNNDSFQAFNVGDSNIYRLRNGILWEISTTDSLADLYPNNPRYTHMISQCMGMPLNINDIHYMDGNIKPNDIYLICSDGIHDVITKQDFEEILTKETDIEQAFNTIVKLAIKRDTKDNYSLIVVAI